MHGNHFGNKNTAHSMLVCMCACTHGHTLSRSIVKLLCTVAFKSGTRSFWWGQYNSLLESSQTYVHA